MKIKVVPIVPPAETLSFPQGAPQREEYDADEEGEKQYWEDCRKYAKEAKFGLGPKRNIVF